MKTRAVAEKLQSLGRGGDTVLAHINPREAAMLKARGGRGSRNPETGLLEFDDGDAPGDAVGDAPGDAVGPSTGDSTNSSPVTGNNGEGIDSISVSLGLKGRSVSRA